MATEMSLDDLMAEWNRLGLARDDEGLTTKELSARWGVGTDAVIRRLSLFQAAGWLRVGRKSSKRIDGLPSRVSCYRIEVPTDYGKKKKSGPGKKVAR